MRYAITKDSKTEWDEALPQIVATLNNSSNATTGRAPNEIAYGQKLNDGLSLLGQRPESQTDVSKERSRHRQEAKDAISYAANALKLRHDYRHKALELQPGSKAFLRLHDGYSIPGLDNRKLSNQRIGPFKVLGSAGPNAYRLELPPVMQIHPTISVTMLEKAPDDADPYDRIYEHEPGPVQVKGVEDEGDSYEVEELLDRKETGRGKRRAISYLVKWKNYGPASNVWYKETDLVNSREKITEYLEKYGPRPRKEANKTGKI